VALSAHPVTGKFRRFLVQTVALAEASSPLLSGVVFSWSYRQDLSYPMDATFFFNVLAVVSVGLYTASLLLHIHIVGDFGRAPEGATLNAKTSHCSRVIEKRCGGLAESGHP